MLVTNLDSHDYPCHAFCDLYHQRWRIEEAFKRLKHRMKLESVSGLSQHALLIDVPAKVLADNIASLMCTAAEREADLPARDRRCNRTYAADARLDSLCAASPRVRIVVVPIEPATRGRR